MNEKKKIWNLYSTIKKKSDSHNYEPVPLYIRVNLLKQNLYI